MQKELAVAASLIALSLCGSHGAARPAGQSSLPKIAIEAKADRRWSVTYQLSAPTRVLAFDRSPDSSRSKTWTAPPDFELVATAQGERVRRRDGAIFATVTLTLTAAYQELPKDYTPFSPFGDGGMLLHSGRFFACADACPDDPEWRISLRAPAGQHVIVDGHRFPGRAAWRDRNDGRNVYVGSATPIASPDVLAVIDTSLPAGIRRRLDAELPRFMRFFAARLGALSTRPLLFASYDATHQSGWGRQGGTLPGQVFTHFYGAGWSAEMTKPGFDFDLAWHFAHEAAHLYQRQIAASDKGAAWVHEGAAEAFAAIALRQLNPALTPQIDAKIAGARAACASARGNRPLNTVIDGGNFDAAYSCGLLLNLAIHDAALATDPRSDGLFAVWRTFAETARGGRAPSLGDYVQAAFKHAGACMGEKVADTAPNVGPKIVTGACQGQADTIARYGLQS